MHYRIGVNLGDVIEESDGALRRRVNIAARLEALAEAGGVVSRAACTTPWKASSTSRSTFWESSRSEPEQAGTGVSAARPGAARGAVPHADGCGARFGGGLRGGWHSDRRSGHGSRLAHAASAPEDAVLALPRGPSIAGCRSPT
jgi:hypothetical protein